MKSFIEYCKVLIDRAEIVSFDMFETLVVRRYVSPLDVFYYIEKKHKVSGFAKNRIESEKQLRSDSYKKGIEEVTLDQIYRSMDSKYLDVKDIEIEVEIDACLKNLQIFELYLYALKKGKNVVVTTETYLPREVLEAILHKNDIKEYSHIFLSSELLLSKAGGLFKYIENYFQNISSKEILHIGDNYHADVSPAARYGFVTCYYQGIYEQYCKKSILGEGFFSKVLKNTSPDLSILIKLCAIFFASNNHKLNSLQLIGAQYVWPMTMLFGAWLINLCRQKQIKKLFFLSRDGFLYLKPFELFFNKGNEIVLTKLFGSRRCFPFQ